MCSLVLYPGNGLPARHIPFRLDRGRAGVPEAAEAPLGRMVYLRWDKGTRRKLLEVDCVVPLRPDVKLAMQSGLELAIEDVVLGNDGPVELAFRGNRPTEPVSDFSSNWIICWWYSGDDSLVCNGVNCVASSAEVRAETVDEVAIGSYYECANGCAVAPYEGLFACSGGGGGGMEEGGSPEEAGGGGGGYCPNTDPECLLPLRYQDEEKIRQALTTVDMTREICAEAANKIGSMLRLGQLYRGNPDIPDDPNDDHEGKARVLLLGIDSYIHIDTDYLNSSSTGALASVLLHEAWHVLGYPDHEGELGPLYGTPPYSEQYSCIVGS